MGTERLAHAFFNFTPKLDYFCSLHLDYQPRKLMNCNVFTTQQLDWLRDLMYRIVLQLLILVHWLSVRYRITFKLLRIILLRSFTVVLQHNYPFCFNLISLTAFQALHHKISCCNKIFCYYLWGQSIRYCSPKIME